MLEKAKPMKEFYLVIYSAMVEKMTIQSSKQLVISLLDGTNIECEME